MHSTNLGDYLHKPVDKMWNIKQWKQTSKFHTLALNSTHCLLSIIFTFPWMTHEQLNAYINLNKNMWYTIIYENQIKLVTRQQVRFNMFEHKNKLYRFLDIHVTVHCDEFLIIKPTRCTNFSILFLEGNSTCLKQFLCPSSGVFHCTHSNGISHTDLLNSLQAGSGWNAVPSWFQK
jgi:hypothetical protein